ncbi:MAG TPA: SUMF1/EgtB/PvdO family nonheme iron enzyme [Planctomycetota bacterium]|nr:SUMF1/EgtB/PvdO family nonheme iron enzyme [Planctomycetota bacterium]
MRSALALVAAFAGACGNGAPVKVPLEIERLGYLAATPPFPWVLQIAEPLVVDLFEVTRGEWSAYLSAERLEPEPSFRRYAQSWTAESESWPASFMTHAEAAEFARWRGMRLLRAEEWLVCAAGISGREFPWGNRALLAANTLDLRLGRPAPVGTFEAGRTPDLSCYDLLGNVAEWVEGRPPGREPAYGGDERVTAMGGSFRSWARALLDAREGAFAWRLQPGSRFDDVGLRCAAPAAEWLSRNAPAWGDDPETRRRLVAVGRRWGRAALPLLEDLASRPGAPRGLAALAEGARQ